ncbi:response regulator transcription factor [Aquicella lusitana]|uniref:Regulatory LuxR family protein n=1 Tax=Aquicella lusitana TaxID=254246 RepID=A0A370GIC7_9COXI|nr:helix-turn-helix transcriptional regulator [Aquicella lusitana]RDI43407.1 regulatory LuxR family protein [Aquicella lusitana]VVC73557.1 Oxygen regulatory protein NreC [Aquicella lusitana]
MHKIVISSGHYILASVSKIQKICAPLFAGDRFSFFDYARFGKQGEFNGFTTNGDSFRIFFDLEYESLKSCKHLSFEENKFNYFYSPPPQSFSDSNDSHAAQEILRVTGADNGFSLLKKRGGFIEAFYFACALPRDKAINYYLNQLPLLHKFINYFQTEANGLLKLAHENTLILPEKMRPKMWGDSLQRPTPAHDRLLSQIKNEIHLTKREIECANYIGQGYTIKEIAELLALSSRTVESHIAHIKTKLNIRRKSELVKYLLRNNLIRY